MCTGPCPTDRHGRLAPRGSRAGPSPCRRPSGIGRRLSATPSRCPSSSDRARPSRPADLRPSRRLSVHPMTLRFSSGCGRPLSCSQARPPSRTPAPSRRSVGTWRPGCPRRLAGGGRPRTRAIPRLEGCHRWSPAPRSDWGYRRHGTGH